MSDESNVLRHEDGSVMRFAFPGGYRVWYVVADGEVLCGPCVEENIDQCEDPDHRDSGWYVVGHTHAGEMEDPEEVTCGHCGLTDEEITG